MAEETCKSEAKPFQLQPDREGDVWNLKVCKSAFITEYQSRNTGFEQKHSDVRKNIYLFIKKCFYF